MTTLVTVHEPLEVVHTKNKDGYIQAWIVQGDGTLKPIISGAKQ